MDKKERKEYEPLDAQQRLAEIMNDTAVPVTVAGETRHIRAIKPGVAALIAEETVKMQRAEKGNMVDLMKRMAECSPAVAKCITLALLNDRDRIYKDYRRKELSDEYHDTYDKVMWESDPGEWIAVLLGVMRLLDVDFFFRITEAMESFRLMMLEKTTTAAR